MTNIIHFLESVGGNPMFKKMSTADYTAVVASLETSDAQKNALLDRDTSALSNLLGGRNKIWCSLYPAKEDEPAKREEKHEEEREGDDNERDPSTPDGRV